MNKKAFTLVEILISIVIIGVLLSGILMVLVNTGRINTNSKMNREAVSIAQTKMEQLLKVNYSSLESGSETKNNYTLNWSVTIDSTYAPSPSLKRIVMEVSWRDFKLQRHRYSLVTLRYQYI